MSTQEVQEKRAAARGEFLAQLEILQGRPSLKPERYRLRFKGGELTGVEIRSTLDAAKGRPEGQQPVAPDGS